jgi:predicted porin
MKRRLLPILGLALMAGSAYAAESGVTLYGVVDVGVATTHASGPNGTSSSLTGLKSGGFTDSLFGIKGTEDLGNGWSTNFTLESLYDVPTGELSDEDHFFSNSAWVGFANDQYGEIRAGRQQTVAQQIASQLEISPWADMGMGSTFKASDNYQVQNAVNYFSPSIGGFSFGLGYSFDVVGDQFNGNRSPAVSLAAQYSQGPLLIAATWDRAYLSEQVRPGNKDPQAWQLGASYDFEVAKVSVAWSRQSNGYVGLDGGDPDDLGIGLGAAEFADGGHLDAYLLGVSVPVSERGTVLAQWSLVKPSWTWRDGEKAQTGQLATLGYTYALSPRTTLYAMGGIATHYSLDDQVVQGQGTTTRLMTGVSHAF